MRFRTVAIIGLGLMGGSLAAAIRKRFPKIRVLGITRNRASLKAALRKKWIHQGVSRLGREVSAADLIVLSTPVDTLPGILNRLDRLAKPGAVATDVGSVKGDIIRALRKKKLKRIRFVGAHPMTGSHRRGMEAASAGLYDQGLTFVIRAKETDARAYRDVRDFWKRISPQVEEVSETEHDEIVAWVSHLPHALAVCLLLTAPSAFLRFASTGFSDTTRVAAGHPSLWLPILERNRAALRQPFKTFEKNFIRIKSALSGRRSDSLARMLREARRKRAQISF